MPLTELNPVDGDDATQVLRLLAIARELTLDMDDFSAHALTCALMEELCERWEQPSWAWLDEDHCRSGRWMI